MGKTRLTEFLSTWTKFEVIWLATFILIGVAVTFFTNDTLGKTTLA